jgi:hypothetical protein
LGRYRITKKFHDVEGDLSHAKVKTDEHGATHFQTNRLSRWLSFGITPSPARRRHDQVGIVPQKSNFRMCDNPDTIAFHQ